MSLFLCLGAYAETDAPKQDYMLYEMKNTDSLRGLAEKFFGGEQYLQELIRYNAVVTPNRVKAGDMIAIPLGVRDRAIAGLSRAEESLAIALTAQADQFAGEAYDHALETLHQARDAREQASYARSIALADLAIVRSQVSIEEADRTAPVQQHATLSAASGTVEVSVDKGITWTPVKAGDDVPVPSRIRTAENSRADLELADKSKVQILESSTFEVQDFLFDRRNGLRRSRMKVILGSILGRITPKDHDDSTFEIETEAAAVAIRGTVLRVGADEDQATRLSVLEGLTQLGAGGDEASVPEGFGSVTEEGQAPGALRELLPAPLPLSPIQDFSTGHQEVTFSWEEVRARDLGAYNFELATDPEFNHLVYRDVLPATKLKSPLLDAGTYYWRVSSLDKKKLEGAPFSPNRLEVELRLDVTVVPAGAYWQSDKQLILGRSGFLQLQAGDSDSSVHAFQSRVGKEDFHEQGNRVDLKEEGSFAIQVRGVARSGQKGPVEKIAAVVDHTPPNVHIDLVPVGKSSNRPVFQLHLKSEDNTGVEKTEYSLNKGPFLEYFGPVPLDPYVSYDVSVRARDHVGNQSAVQDLHVMAGWPEEQL